MLKPILFLDFDRTLFDTEQLYACLGEATESRIRAFIEGTINTPNLASMLYPDTLPFLEQARDTHRLVLLTYTLSPALQEKKIRESGVISYLNDIIMTHGEGGGSGKGVGAQTYLRTSERADGHMFVDDALENISEVKTVNPQVRCVRILRVRSTETTLTTGLLPPDDVVANLPELFALFSQAKASYHFADNK